MLILGLKGLSARDHRLLLEREKFVIFSTIPDDFQKKIKKTRKAAFPLLCL